MSSAPPPDRRDWFDVSRFQAALSESGSSWGLPLSTPGATASTNDLALEAERAGAPAGSTFVARAQTEGRGRRGNGWWAAPGDNLTFSLLLRPERDAAAMSALPLVVGLAVREVVSAELEAATPWAGLGAPPTLVKWPNDVWVGSRKIAGVLVESRLRGGCVSAAVVGIGLNVHTRQFPSELATQATSLAREIATRARPTRRAPSAGLSTRPSDHEELLARVLGSLERRYRQFICDGLAPLLAELDAWDALRGRAVRVEGVTGTASGIAEDGALRIVTAAGAVHRVHFGHIELMAEP